MCRDGVIYTLRLEFNQKKTLGSKGKTHWKCNGYCSKRVDGDITRFEPTSGSGGNGKGEPSSGGPSEKVKLILPFLISETI